MTGKRSGAGSKSSAKGGRHGTSKDQSEKSISRRDSAVRLVRESTASFRGARKANPKVVSFTAEDAARIPSRTDFARLDAMTDEDIARAVADDPDAAPIFTDEMLARSKWVEPLKKTPISFRVDPDVLEFFKENGAGYQSRMNAVLRAYMERSKKAR